MEYLQITLTIILLVIEVIAFAWLIIDIQKSKKKQDKIIELEHQILSVEDSIIELDFQEVSNKEDATLPDVASLFAKPPKPFQNVPSPFIA